MAERIGIRQNHGDGLVGIGIAIFDFTALRRERRMLCVLRFGGNCNYLLMAFSNFFVKFMLDPQLAQLTLAGKLVFGFLRSIGHDLY